MDRYAARFQAALAAIASRDPRGPTRLEAYAGLYGDVLAKGRMCLCGMLAAEYETLPPSVQRAIRAFFDANEEWLEDVLERGRAEGDLAFAESARDAARQWTAALEGAMLLARPFGEVARLRNVVRRMIDDLSRPAPAPPRAAPTRAARRRAAARLEPGPRDG